MVKQSQFCYSAKFDLDDNGMEPSKSTTFDGQNCSRLAKNLASRVDPISSNDNDDENTTILRRLC